MTGIGQIHINNFYSTGKMIIGGCFVWFFLEGRNAFLKYAFHLFLPSPMFYLEPSKKLTSSKTLCDDQCFTLSKTFGVILGAKHSVTTIVLLGVKHWVFYSEPSSLSSSFSSPFSSSSPALSALASKILMLSNRKEGGLSFSAILISISHIIHQQPHTRCSPLVLHSSLVFRAPFHSDNRFDQIIAKIVSDK